MPKTVLCVDHDLRRNAQDLAVDGRADDGLHALMRGDQVARDDDVTGLASPFGLGRSER
jgi:hypothetical protein